MKAEEVFLTDLDALLASDETTGGHPVLPGGSRERIARKLARLIFARELLVDHIRALKRRVGKTLRHFERLPEGLHEAVVQGGPGILDDSWLAKLPLNPIALCALRDSLFELPGDDLPEGWCELLEREGSGGLYGWDDALEVLARRAGPGVAP
jgi:hypothetical protein